MFRASIPHIHPGENTHALLGCRCPASQPEPGEASAQPDRTAILAKDRTE